MRQHALAWAAVAALVLTSAVLHALEQAPTAPPPESVGSPEPTPALIVPYNGGSAVVTAAPAELPHGEVREMAAAEEHAMRDVASGDTSIAEATRDASETPDPGSSVVFWLIAALFGGAVRPPIDYAVEKSHLDDRLGGAVHVAAVAGFYLLLWALLHGRYPSLPQDWTSWLIAAGLGGGAGAAAQSGLRAAQGHREAPPAAQEGRP